MKILNNASQKLQSITNSKLNVLILGATGSVGTYLTQYLYKIPNINIHIASRSTEKLHALNNILKVSNTIQGYHHNELTIHKIDVNTIGVLTYIIDKFGIDIVVNATRAHTGIKYGSISWKTIRAYGIWAPLSVELTRKISEQCNNAGRKPILINTSYSDVINPWLKSAGLPFPDLGSGNVNHLIPRMQFALSEMNIHKNVDYTEILLATSHFHDVVISKEGHTEDIEVPFILTDFTGSFSVKEMWQKCNIEMPTDSTRNMMNASSNFQIILAIVSHKLAKTKTKTFHIPGPDGEIGGYPVFIESDYFAFDERLCSFELMQKSNNDSIYLDGIEKIEDGYLYYTDKIINDANEKLHYKIPKRIHINESSFYANELIDLIESFRKS